MVLVGIELVSLLMRLRCSMFSRHSLLKPFCLRDGRVRILILTFGLWLTRSGPLAHAIFAEVD
jgi:hypothetical protein